MHYELRKQRSCIVHVLHSVSLLGQGAALFGQLNQKPKVGRNLLFQR